MARRDDVVVWVDQPCDGGVSVEIRASWPTAATTYDDVMMAVTRAIGKLVVAAQREGLPPPPDWVAAE